MWDKAMTAAITSRKRSGVVNAGLLVCAEPLVNPQCARPTGTVCPAAYRPTGPHRAGAWTGRPQAGGRVRGIRVRARKMMLVAMPSNQPRIADPMMIQTTEACAEPTTQLSSTCRVLATARATSTTAAPTRSNAHA